ncbi:hypothetical protein KAR04_09855 [Candidatus Calescamantes bacterium]|nr:hypothetical protein [Candidatus Calescamantes bacterium]
MGAFYWLSLIQIPTIFIALFRYLSKFRNKGRVFRIIHAAVRLLSIITLIFSLLEISFNAFFINSDSFGFTLSSKIWLQRYWKPINEQGYRDNEISTDTAKAKIVVLGDSVAAGHGIKNIKNRMAAYLASEVGPDLTVNTIAKCGWDTPDQVAALKTRSDTPAFVFLVHYINDVDYLGRKYHVERAAYPDVPSIPFISLLVNNTLIFNSLFWNIYKGANSELGEQYWEYLLEIYRSDNMLIEHVENIESIREYLSQYSTGFHVILVPDLAGLAASRSLMTRLAEFLDIAEIGYTDITDSISQIPEKKLVVSRMDAHPSILVHKIIGNAMAEHINDLDNGK